MEGSPTTIPISDVFAGFGGLSLDTAALCAAYVVQPLENGPIGRGWRVLGTVRVVQAGILKGPERLIRSRSAVPFPQGFQSR